MGPLWRAVPELRRHWPQLLQRETHQGGALMVLLSKTDGGRQSSGFFAEKKDCTVRSFALAADIPYGDAWQVAKRSGRKMGKGWWPEKILTVAKQDGLVEFVWSTPSAQTVRAYSRLRGFFLKTKYPTITEIARRYPKGRYILSTRTHATALIDGVIHDTGVRERA